MCTGNWSKAWPPKKVMCNMIFHFEAVEDKATGVCGSGWLRNRSGDKGRSKNVHKNGLIQKKMERALGSHDSQMTQRTPAV